MSKNLYKYAGPSNFEKIFEDEESVTLKCSYPKDFNDPYELFLTVDFNEDPDDLAFYAEAVGEIPQLPTTCFSRSPAVVPMWAHYAQNLEGFVIEFDEAKFAEAMPDSKFGDITYQDSAHEGLQGMLLKASRIGKGRYVYMLRGGVKSAAYFTKASCWSYEQERRMVATEDEVRTSGPIMLIDVPSDCVKSLICGPRASADLKAAIKAKAEEFGCNYYQIRIGRTTANPFFVDALERPHVFNGMDIEPSAQHCSSCSEPLPTKQKACSWCQIDESHQRAAAGRNPFRMYANLGLLDNYIEGMDEITRNFQKK